MHDSVGDGIVIQPIDRGKTRSAVNVLCRAFAQDPILGHYFHEPIKRAEAFRVFFADAVYAFLRYGHVYAAMDRQRVRGVAAWMPPDAGPPNSAEGRHAREAERRVRALFPETAGGIYGGFAALQELHPLEPHWYLAFLGVEPDFQSRGLGSRLLAPVLNEADRAGLACYLETPFPRTHAFYARHGFVVTGETDAFGAAGPVWTLQRSPAPGSCAD